MLNKDTIKKIERIIGYTFEDASLLTQAFTMPSYRAEHPDVHDNRVLTFFGKKVLSHAVSDILIDRYTFRDDSGVVSYMQEDGFSKMYHNCVDVNYIADKMRALQVHTYIMAGDDSVTDTETLAVLLQSLVAAIYLDTEKKMSIAKPVFTKLLGL